MTPRQNANYQLLLDSTIARHASEGTRPRLLLHACCAPCSSYVLEYLCQHFDITLYFYNPNISPRSEYERRHSELQRLLRDMGIDGNVRILECDYSPELFDAISKGLEDADEGGKRCYACYELRLRSAAEAAKRGGFDYFTTTLSISPHKKADWLCEIGGRLSGEYGVPYLYSDFKKRGGYKRSIELSGIYGLYRQDYCGCKFSKKAREKQKAGG